MSKLDNLLDKAISDNLLNQAMLMLAAQPGAIFIGQNVCYDGNVMYKDLAGIPKNRIGYEDKYIETISKFLP